MMSRKEKIDYMVAVEAEIQALDPASREHLLLSQNNPEPSNIELQIAALQLLINSNFEHTRANAATTVDVDQKDPAQMHELMLDLSEAAIAKKCDLIIASNNYSNPSKERDAVIEKSYLQLITLLKRNGAKKEEEKRQRIAEFAQRFNKDPAEISTASYHGEIKNPHSERSKQLLSKEIENILAYAYDKTPPDQQKQFLDTLQKDIMENNLSSNPAMQGYLSKSNFFSDSQSKPQLENLAREFALAWVAKERTNKILETDNNKSFVATYREISIPLIDKLGKIIEREKTIKRWSNEAPPEPKAAEVTEIKTNPESTPATEKVEEQTNQKTEGRKKIILLDFDDTIETKINGKIVLNTALVAALKQAQAEGATVIGYTNWYSFNYVTGSTGRQHIVELLKNEGLDLKTVVTTYSPLHVYDLVNNNEERKKQGQTHQEYINSRTENERYALLNDFFQNHISNLENDNGYRRGAARPDLGTNMLEHEKKLSALRSDATNNMGLSEEYNQHDRKYGEGKESGKEAMFRVVLAVLGKENHYIVFDDKRSVIEVTDGIATKENVDAHAFKVDALLLQKNNPNATEDFSYTEAINNPEATKQKIAEAKKNPPAPVVKAAEAEKPKIQTTPSKEEKRGGVLGWIQARDNQMSDKAITPVTNFLSDYWNSKSVVKNAVAGASAVVLTGVAVAAWPITLIGAVIKGASMMSGNPRYGEESSTHQSTNKDVRGGSVTVFAHATNTSGGNLVDKNAKNPLALASKIQASKSADPEERLATLLKSYQEARTKYNSGDDSMENKVQRCGQEIAEHIQGNSEYQKMLGSNFANYDADGLTKLIHKLESNIAQRQHSASPSNLTSPTPTGNSDGVDAPQHDGGTKLGM